MTRIFALAAAFAFCGTMTLADLAPETLASTYQTNGYTNIEVKVGATQLKIEAIKDSVKIKAVYDIATGEIVKSKTRTASSGTTISDTVEIRLDDHSDSADDNGDHMDMNDESDHGNANGSDHDSGDHHGSGDNHGSGDSDHSGDSHDSGKDHSGNHESHGGGTDD